MPTSAAKPTLWFLEEATPEVAQLMHQLERALGSQATLARVGYLDALRNLPAEAVRQDLAAIVVFSLPNLQNLAALIKGFKGPRPKLCFVPPTYEAFAALRVATRWPLPVAGVVRHLGEAALLAAANFKPDGIIRLQADIHPAGLPEPGVEAPAGQPLRVGFAWYNMAPAQRDSLAMQVARWQQSAPDRCQWTVICLPGDEPPPGVLDDIARVVLVPEPDDENPAARPMAGESPIAFDVWLADPWWPEVVPRPWRAPVTIDLPPGGAAGDPWEERLQALLDQGDAATWNEDLLWSFAWQPLWKNLLRGDAPAPEERPVPMIPAADLAQLVAERARWHAWLLEARERLAPVEAEAEGALAPASFFALYDYRVEVSWCIDLWTALANARDQDRPGLIATLGALRLHHTGACWLFKRLLATTPAAKRQRTHHFGRRFWLNFAMRNAATMGRWLHTLWRCGRDQEVDPLAAGRVVSEKLLAAAGVTIVRRNEPAPAPGVPTIYLLSHRHGDLDPFLLLACLPGHLAVVVGPRAQRWPLVSRLAHSSAFVLTGRERGVVIADAIGAVRARRALALYPEVAEPSYLGEGAPLRSGLLWIVQALERSQVIPVVLDDAYLLGPEGGQVDLWFGPPIPCTPEGSDDLLARVRVFYQRHLARITTLDQT